MKKIKTFAAAAIFCAAAFAGYTAYDKATMTDEEKMFQANLEALTRVEDWEGKKLKIVSCTCPETQKKGDTFKCEDDGDLEPCTETQQGSNACYKAGFSGITLC